MANWGKPDYRDSVSDTEKGALWRRIREETNGEGLTAWPHNDQVQAGYPLADVQAYCVRSSSWQAVRLSMKGKNTHEKLAILKAWWDKHIDCCPYETMVQVGNYLGALRRGGQLDNQNRVRRYR